MGDGAETARFIVSTRQRLHQAYAKELAEAEKPFAELLRGESAIRMGLLKPSDPEWSSWFLAELARSVFHFYAFAAHTDGELEIIKERLWEFCLGLGGRDSS